MQGTERGCSPRWCGRKRERVRNRIVSHVCQGTLFPRDVIVYTRILIFSGIALYSKFSGSSFLDISFGIRNSLAQLSQICTMYGPSEEVELPTSGSIYVLFTTPPPSFVVDVWRFTRDEKNHNLVTQLTNCYLQTTF